MAKYIMSGLEMSGLTCGAYVGFKYGNSTREALLNYSPYCSGVYTNNIKPRFRKNKSEATVQQHEKYFFNTIGCLACISLSWYLNGWILFIPLVAYEFLQ